MADIHSDKRQQTEPANPQRRPGGADKTGSGTSEPPRDSVKYRDRPADEGKHGDAAEEPNEGFPHDP
jgi:hypothetical protein